MHLLRGACCTLLALASMTGCRQLLGLGDLPSSSDASGSDMCVDVCSGSTLHACGMPDTTCDLGCVTDPATHCGVFQPSGGGVLPTDLDPSMLGGAVIAADVVIDGDAGTITAGNGTITGFGFTTRNNIAVFTFGSLIGSGTWSITGSHAIALVSQGDMMLSASIDARGSAGGCNGSTPGPGGFAGGDATLTALGSGAGRGGTGNNNDATGGGGGGNGAIGGNGGAGQSMPGALGGVVFGNPEITMLVGGGGGGGGGGGNANDGGGGGGALQLVASHTLELSGSINAGGCGGSHGGGGSGGAGGGAGGTILVEARLVHLTTTGYLAANGGGGGGAGGLNGGQDGDSGNSDNSNAHGGSGNGNNAGDGGNGGGGSPVPGDPGSDGETGGGGGGGAGRIRINTFTGAATIDAGMHTSPSLGTTATQGTIVVH